jgi:hypothetical protein
LRAGTFSGTVDFIDRRNPTKEKGAFGLARDDWKYHDEDMEEEEEGERKPPPPEIQCGNCLRWIPRESPSCSWCGKRIERKERDRS